MHTRMTGWAALLAATLMAGPVNAGYFGASYTENTLEDWDKACAGFSDGSLSEPQCEDSDDGYRLFGGFGENPNFLVEIGYSDFGEATFDAQSSGCCTYPAGPVSAVATITGIDVSLLGRVPITKTLAATARFGMMKWETESTVAGNADGSDFLFAGGLELATSAAMSVRAEAARHKLDDSNLDSLSLSLIFRGP